MASKDAGLFIEDELDINDLEFEDKILSSCKPDESIEYGAGEDIKSSFKRSHLHFSRCSSRSNGDCFTKKLFSF